MLTSDLYLEYTNYTGNSDCLKLKGFYFGVNGRTIENFGYSEVPVGRRRILKCTCGSNNWTDNGYSINVYECDSCGMFLTAY